jgi:hypothetical protein
LLQKLYKQFAHVLKARPALLGNYMAGSFVVLGMGERRLRAEGDVREIDAMVRPEDRRRTGLGTVGSVASTVPPLPG